jgi:hypothetical protein
MATDSGKDTSRTVVKTYVPAYQREEWDDHAEELDMSRSEFVKAMVQAGRRGFEPRERPRQIDPKTDSTDEDRSSDPSTVAGGSVEDAVLDALSADQYLSWDELLAAVSDNIETRLEDTLQELQSENRVRYSGRHGGYTLEQ